MGNNQFEKISFWQLLKNTKIQIPITQRDYAQGRENQEKVRAKFLTALSNALNGQPIELDFVYGSEKANNLQPLDGQQRLTTLFLLHWFIAIKEGKLNNNVKECLKKFTYETRSSSREFCNDLVEKGMEYNPSENISTQIKDTAWFVASWKNDATISAMLIMLDAIQMMFKNNENLWEKLIDTQNPPITFLYIKLENFGLSDDLYIKMNARGKELTSFENFKSQFEKYIENNKFEEGITDFEETFAHRIDTVWTDLFWQYRGEDNLVDNEFIQFVAETAINYYAEKQTLFVNEEAKKQKNITDTLIKRTRLEQRIARLATNPNEITPEDFPTKESFEYLKSCLDKYTENGNSKIKTGIDLWSYSENGKTLFDDVVQKGKMTYPKRVLFYAQTLYLLENKEFIQENFNDWMRVVRNIVHNATIDSADAFIGAIKLIAELAAGSNDIYGYLCRNAVASNFASARVKEAIAKAQLVITNQENKSIIHNMEDTDFCKGKIDFALYCVDYDIEETPNTSSFDKEKFNKLYPIIKEFKLNNSLTNEFKRAFLTVRNNNYYDVWGSWSHTFSCHKKWLCRTFQDIKNNFTNKNDWRNYLKELLIKRLENDFVTICANYVISTGMPKWKARLIKEDNLLNNATFVLIPNDNSYCKLASQQRPTREDQVTKID